MIKARYTYIQLSAHKIFIWNRLYLQKLVHTHNMDQLYNKHMGQEKNQKSERLMYYAYPKHETYEINDEINIEF